MGFNFPNTPAVNDLWPTPAISGQPQYKWDGQKWIIQSATGGATPVYTDGSTPMTAQLKLFGSPPVATNDAAPKSYVDGGVRFDTAQALTANQRAQARANIDALKKNYIINGAMMISQENASAAGTVTGYYPVDQFFSALANTTGALSLARVASLTPAGSPNRIRVTVTTAEATAATKIVTVSQVIEGVRVSDLKSGTATAKTVTLQFGVKAPAGTYCVAFRNGVTSNRSYIAEYTIAAGEANTDVVKSVTLTLDTTGTWANDNSWGLAVSWALLVGTSFQTPAGVWTAGNFPASSNQFNFMGTNGNVFELFDVGLYEGNVAPPFMVPDFNSELEWCQRYWELQNYNVLLSAYAANCYISCNQPWATYKRSLPTCANVGTPTTVNAGAPSFTANGSNSVLIIAISTVAATQCQVSGSVSGNARM